MAMPKISTKTQLEAYARTMAEQQVEIDRLRSAVESARTKLIECASRLEDSKRVIESEDIADEDDLEAENLYLAEVRAFADALGKRVA
jgi:hypothetical protein